MPRSILLSLTLLLTLLGAGAYAQPKATVEATANLSALKPGADAMVAVVITIPEKLHAQSHTPSASNYIALVVTPGATEGLAFAQPRYPPGEDKEYPALGKLNVYEGRVVVHIPVKVDAGVKPGPARLTGKVLLQMCDDQVCFRPQTTTFAVDTRFAEAGAAVEPVRPELFENVAPATAPAALVPTTAPAAQSTGPSIGVPPPQGVSPQGTVSQGGSPPESPPSTAWQFLVAFGVGMIFNVMPCVLPVLPLKAIGFYEAARHSRLRSLWLAVAFSVGIVAVFAALGVLILVTKQLSWGQQFGNPYFLWPLVGILLAMGIGLMGTFALRLPTAVYNVTPRHDTVGGNVGFGMLTAVLSTPCTAFFFPPLLLWARTQPTYVGVAALMTVGVGMAFPYVVLSAFPNVARNLPRVGPWAELFKQMMGWLLIGSAVFFAAGRLIQGNAFWWSTVVVAVVAGTLLVVRSIQLGAGRRGVTIAAIVAVALPVTTSLISAHMNGLFTPPDQRVAWVPFSDVALAEARAKGQTVLVKFTANWCGNCQYIEGTVFNDRATVGALQQANVLSLKADLTLDDAPGTTLLNTLNPGGGIPLTAVYGPGRDTPVQLNSIYTTQTLLDTLMDVTTSDEVARP